MLELYYVWSWKTWVLWLDRTLTSLHIEWIKCQLKLQACTVIKWGQDLGPVKQNLFSEKLWFSYPSVKTCVWCSKEPSHWDGSFEYLYPQHMFWLRNKKNNLHLCTLVWGLSRFKCNFLDFFQSRLWWYRQQGTHRLEKYLNIQDCL